MPYLSVVTMFTAPGLGISLYLAREFAGDAELLQAKLTEAERLPAQTLAQEQEKQALLAANTQAALQELRVDYSSCPVELVLHLDLLPFELGQVGHSLVSHACCTLAAKSKTAKDFTPELRGLLRSPPAPARAASQRVAFRRQTACRPYPLAAGWAGAEAIRSALPPPANVRRVGRCGWPGLGNLKL